MGNYIIGYDIANPRRLVRIHREMKMHATPLQYSIFLLEGNRKDLQHCLDRILPLMDAKQDDVRCYQLPIRGDRSSLPFRFRIGALLQEKCIRFPYGKE